MVERPNINASKEKVSKTIDGFSKFAREKSTQVAEQAEDAMDSTKEFVHDTAENLKTKKNDEYESAIAEYNSAFTLMNDKGLTLLRQRERSTDQIEFVELLVNSIANTPKSFETDFEEIHVNRANFMEAEEFVRKDLEAARNSATSAGAGFAAGAAVASVTPSVALWAATTFGAASTGTAISTLSGAAATNAALAWLGGGALAAGGGGMTAGTALLALAGPVGWTIAGATILSSIGLFAKKKVENRKDKQEAIMAVKQNTATVLSTDAQLGDLLERTHSLREMLKRSYSAALPLYGANFLELTSAQQDQLSALVNNTKACAAQLGHRIEQTSTDE